MWDAGNVSCKVGILTQPIVQEDIESIFKIVGDDLNRLRGKRVLITGGTGFIGTWLLETISWLNTNCNQPCKVYVPTRNPEAFARKAPHLASNPELSCCQERSPNFSIRMMNVTL